MNYYNQNPTPYSSEGREVRQKNVKNYLIFDLQRIMLNITSDQTGEYSENRI